MNIAILGTGGVARTLAPAISARGHHVVMGTRDPAATLARVGQDGAASFADWAAQNPEITLATFSEAVVDSQAILLAVPGSAAVQVLHAAGTAALGDKILLDITNPLDFSEGFPPTLFISNTDSLGETLQREFPQVRVVKTLNTVNAALMVAPRDLADGDHSLFVSGNDEAAKRQVIAWLGEWFGWQDVIDLGDITTARGTEQLLALWVRLLGTLGTPRFQFKIVR